MLAALEIKYGFVPEAYVIFDKSGEVWAEKNSVEACWDHISNDYDGFNRETTLRSICAVGPGYHGSDREDDGAEDYPRKIIADADEIDDFYDEIDAEAEDDAAHIATESMQSRFI